VALFFQTATWSADGFVFSKSLAARVWLRSAISLPRQAWFRKKTPFLRLFLLYIFWNCRICTLKGKSHMITSTSSATLSTVNGYQPTIATPVQGNASSAESETPPDTVHLSPTAQVTALQQQGLSVNQIALSMDLTTAEVNSYLGITTAISGGVVQSPPTAPSNPDPATQAPATAGSQKAKAAGSL
jgi:hypothetical protein